MSEDGRTTAARARRVRRQAEIVAATRELFDRKGRAAAYVETIAEAVGINKAILYRVFTNKEELVAHTLVSYLGELADALRDAGGGTGGGTPPERLEAIVEAFVEYAAAHPAFVDSASTLMARPGEDLYKEMSAETLLALGTAITDCLGVLTATLAEGAERGDFRVEDPELAANMLYASGLGALQLARVGFFVTTGESGRPEWRKVTRDQIRDYLTASARALVAG